MKKLRYHTIPLDKLELNTGQLGWLPRNPRTWTQDDIDRGLFGGGFLLARAAAEKARAAAEKARAVKIELSKREEEIVAGLTKNANKLN